MSNRHTEMFKKRIDSTSKALTYLDKHGCAIVSLSINDNGNTITILPPPKNTLRAIQNTITNGTSGRSYSMLARLNGCNIVWQQSQTN